MFAEDPINKVPGLVNTGPVEVEPALTNIWPNVPGPKNAVLPEVVWNGI